MAGCRWWSTAQHTRHSVGRLYSFNDHFASPILQALVNIGGLPVMEYRTAYETLFGQQLELAPDGTTLVSHMMVRELHQKHPPAPAVER